jgi:oligopeptide transport system substrate-binding protein
MKVKGTYARIVTWARRTISWIILAVMVSGLTACVSPASNEPDESPTSKQSEDVSGTEENTEPKAISMNCQPEDGNYDPAGAASWAYFMMATYTLEGLVRYDANSNIIPATAESWETNDDATEWTFHLRKDARWSDDSPVTSADFLNTITRSLDPNTGSWYVTGLANVAGALEAYFDPAVIDGLGVETPDDHTIIFHLAAPQANFLDYLRLPVFMPSNSRYATPDDATWSFDVDKNLGNGPFRLAGRVEGDYIKIVPNEYYYDRDRVKIDEITIRYMTDIQAALSAYKTGELNVVNSAPYYVEDQYAGQPDLNSDELLQTNFVLFDVNKAPFDDVRVRQAFSMAIDRQAICDTIGSTVPSTLFVAGSYKSKVDGRLWSEVQDVLIDENVEKARALLADAGYPNGEGLPEITYTYPSMGNEGDVAQVLQAQWLSNLGVDVKLNAMEYEVYVTARRAGELQVCRHQWTGDYNDPATWLDMYATGNDQNSVSWSNEAYDALMIRSAGELDTTAREALLLAAEKIIVSDEAVLSPVYNTEAFFLIDPKITDFEKYMNGGFVFTWSDIKE